MAGQVVEFRLLIFDLPEGLVLPLSHQKSKIQNPKSSIINPSHYPSSKRRQSFAQQMIEVPFGGWRMVKITCGWRLG